MLKNNIVNKKYDKLFKLAITKNIFTKSLVLCTLLLIISSLLTHCKPVSNTAQSFVIQVENPVSLTRNNETVTIPIALIKKVFQNEKANYLQIKDLKNNTIITSQSIDYNEDGNIDEFLFQTNFDSNEKKEFEIKRVTKDSLVASKVYAAFIPTEEGMEDFTWENDRIGYRFYGQERAKKQGTGIAIDIWCKRVPEFLTDKWYTPSQNYHIDTGYGADHYKSGKNQGCGGSGIFKNRSIYFSKPFYDWKIIANGPIRTIFELKFTGWDVNDNLIETKRISLDAGHYLNKIESHYNLDIDSLGYSHAVGIVLREDSDIKIAENLDFIVNWESLGENKGNMGTSFIGKGRSFAAIKKHVLALQKPVPKITNSYYVGASIENKVIFIKNPCKISIKQG